MGEVRQIGYQFHAVPVELCRNRTVSSRAVGLFVRLMDIPPGGSYDARELAARYPEGRQAVLAAMAELKALGWVAQDRVRRGSAWTTVTYVNRDRPRTFAECRAEYDRQQTLDLQHPPIAPTRIEPGSLRAVNARGSENRTPDDGADDVSPDDDASSASGVGFRDPRDRDPGEPDRKDLQILGLEDPLPTDSGGAHPRAHAREAQGEGQDQEDPTPADGARQRRARRIANVLTRVVGDAPERIATALRAAPPDKVRPIRDAIGERLDAHWTPTELVGRIGAGSWNGARDVPALVLHRVEAIDVAAAPGRPRTPPPDAVPVRERDLAPTLTADEARGRCHPRFVPKHLRTDHGDDDA